VGGGGGGGGGGKAVSSKFCLQRKICLLKRR